MPDDNSPSNWNEMLALGRKEHERALNRVRQQRYRNARNGRNAPVVSKRVQRVMSDIMHGESRTKALENAGFACSSVQVATEARTAIAEEAKAHGIDRQMVYKNIVRRDTAKKTIPVGETYIEADDWAAQSTACRDAIVLLDRAGELPSPQAQAGGAGGLHFHLHLEQLASHTLDVVDISPDNRAITSDARK
jgi:hypothetical protein